MDPLHIIARQIVVDRSPSIPECRVDSLLDSYTEAFIDVANKASDTLIYDSSNYEQFFIQAWMAKELISIGFGALTPKIASTSLTISKTT